MELQFGLYNGEVSDNKPHGKGGVTFYPDDLGGRKVFDGTWVNGRRDGPGKMTWTTGEVKYKLWSGQIVRINLNLNPVMDMCVQM